MGSTLKLAKLAVISLFVAGCGSEHGERELLKGRQALEAGDYVIAKTWLQNTVNKTANTEIKARAYNYIGVACWNLKELQQAVDAFRTARDLNPESLNASYNLGILALKKGDTSTAIALIEEASMLNTGRTRPIEHLGAIYLQEKRWADARRVYMAAMETSPDSPRIITAAGLAEFNLQCADTARKHWMRAIELDKSYAPALFNLAVVDLTMLQMHDEGIKLANRFLAIEKQGQQAQYIRNLVAKLSATTPNNETPTHSADNANDTAADTGLDNNSTQDILALARAKRKSGESAYALNLCLQEASRAQRENDLNRQAEALQTAANICFEQPRAHYALGRFYMKNNEPEKARKSLRQAVALEPEWTAARVAIAECSIILEEYDAAIIYLKKALQQDEKNPEALWDLAQLYDRHVGDTASAAEIYQKFSKLFPGDPRVLTAQDRLDSIQPPEDTPLTIDSSTDESGQGIRVATIRKHNAAVIEFNQGVSAQSRQDWTGAIKHYQNAAKLNGRLVRAHFNLGVAYGATDNNTAAEKAYLATIDISPDYVNAHFNLALIYFNRTDYTNADKQLNLLLKTDPSYAKAHFLLGMTSSKRGNNNQAKIRYRKFLQLAPHDPNAPQIRAWLQKH